MEKSNNMESALKAVLRAASRSGCDLDSLLQAVTGDIEKNGDDILPEDRVLIVQAVEHAVLDLQNPFNEEVDEVIPAKIYVPPPAPHPPRGQRGADEMPCPDCNGKQLSKNGEQCNLCVGTGTVARY